MIVDDLRLVRERLGHTSLHPIGLREVVRGEGALRHLAATLRRAGVAEGSVIAVLCDSTPKKYANEELMGVVLAEIGGPFEVRLEILESNSTQELVLADEDTVARALHQIGRHRPSALVSVGSGTVTDIAKVIAGQLAILHVVVQSAASVNGYADDQSVLLVKGAKRTTPSRWPDVLIVDPLVVALAPLAMTRSGLGDQLSMFTAAADWYLADAVGFDTSFSPVLVAFMRDGVERLLAASDDLGRGETNAVDTLSDFLTRGGIAMGVAGRTAPSSGLEHTISHLLEMDADAKQLRSAPHGAQVGVASVVAALVWRRIQSRLVDGPVTLIESNVATRERVLDAFTHLDASGVTANECWNLYQRKATWIRSHIDDLADVVNKWSQHQVVINTLLWPVEELVATLKAAKAAVTFEQLTPTPERAVTLWALSNCHLLRDRFGVLDLADLIGAWSPSDVLAVLDELHEVTR